MGKGSGRTLIGTTLAVGLLLSLVLSGCIGDSPLPVVFDQVLEATTVNNRLLSPVVIYRNGEVLDTLPSRTLRRYPIGEKGIFRHGWRLISPRNPSGVPYGIEPVSDLGIQYAIEESIEIRNRADGEEIFTPRIVNATFRTLRLAWVNFADFDERFVGLPLFRNEGTSIEHAPYFYWNSGSNVVIEDQGGFRVWVASREDTNSFGEPELELTDDPWFSGSGATDVILVY